MAENAPLSRDALIEAMAKGAKPKDQWRIGAEHEKFGFHKTGLERPAYDGPGGIEAMLEGLQRFGWSRVEENGVLIGLERRNAEGFVASVSLEPGGQLELSGAPLLTIHDICNETGQHLMEVKQVADQIGVGFLGLGFDPLWRRDQIPVMPKGRYDIMRAYMPKVGSLGLDMMLRTCTIQANLDFDSEADMVAKFRTSLALQPIATALFANSPFTEGRPNGFLSARSEIWRDTDNDRAGMLPFAFEDGFGFEQYVDYALDVPMYFVKRGETYHDVAGASFRDLMAGRLEQLPGELPTMSDWANHLSTIFPEVRLKRFLEMRGADGGPTNRICALPSFWGGIYYDAESLDAAWELVKGWTAEQRQALRDAVPREGLRATVAGRSVLDVAKDALAFASAGLKRRKRLNWLGEDETIHLKPLLRVVEDERTLAEDLLARFDGPWGGSVDPVFADMAY